MIVPALILTLFGAAKFFHDDRLRLLQERAARWNALEAHHTWLAIHREYNRVYMSASYRIQEAQFHFKNGSLDTAEYEARLAAVQTDLQTRVADLKAQLEALYSSHRLSP